MLKNGETLYNKTKWMLKEGKRTVGSWLQLGSNLAAEIIAKAEPDWVNGTARITNCKWFNEWNAIWPGGLGLGDGI